MGSNGHRTEEGTPLKLLHWHVGEWYFRCRRFPSYASSETIRYCDKGVLHELERERRGVWRFVLRHPDVDAQRVRDALEWLDAQWDSHVGAVVGRNDSGANMFWPLEPMVPREILEAHLPGDEVIRNGNGRRRTTA